MKSKNIMMYKKHMYVVGRVLMGLFFVVAGLMKLMEPAGTAAAMTNAGLPMAGILVWLVIVFLIVAGGMVISGRMLCLSGVLLSVYVLLASFLFHMGDASGFMKNIALIGGLLAFSSSCMDKKCCAGGVCKPFGSNDAPVEREHHPEHDHGGHNH